MTSEGDIQNKLSATGDHLKNSVVYNTAIGASVAGTTMLTRKILKSQPLQDTLVKTIDKTAKTTGKGLTKLFPKLKPGLLKVGKMFSEIPGFVKACGAVIMASSTIISHLMRAKTYNQGKIAQKHADIAQLKNKTALE